MKHWLLLLLLALATRQAESQNVTAWTNGYWFNGASFVSADVYSSGGKLLLTPPRAVDQTVDLAGSYVTPAFGEAHNHNIPGAEATYVAQGIFYVMIQQNVPGARRPRTIDVAFANGAFTAPGGHPSALVERNIANGSMTAHDRDGGFLLPVSSESDVDRQWENITSQQPDFIKMILVYSEDRVAGVPRPTSTDRHGLDPALAPYIVKRAHGEGRRVSAHVESAFDFDVAVRAGADVIAHLPGFWPDGDRLQRSGMDLYKISDGTASTAAEHGTVVVTTLGESLEGMANDPSAPRPHPFLEVYRHNIETLVKHGVRIVIGSDQFRSTSVGEALAIHKAGLMAPSALLRALSSDAAEAIFPKRGPFGFKAGAPADFLVFDANPLSDFTIVQRPRLRVRAGTVLK
jgi:hypothetical protein